MKISHGIDLVKVGRVARLRSLYGDRFLRRVFSDNEINECQKRYSQNMHFAARFAAKEAFVKALGTGFQNGIKLRDIEVISINGVPILNLHGEAKVIFSKKYKNVQLSLTHEDEIGAASVILTGD